MRRHRAALDEDLFGERDADALAGGGVVARRRVPAFDGFDGAGLVAGREEQPVADLERAALDAAGEDAALVEAIDILDGEAQRLVLGAARRR